MGFEENLVKGADELLYVLTHSNTTDPTPRHIAFILKNYTDELIHDSGFIGLHLAQVFPPRSIPTTISPRKTGGWVIQTNPEQQDSIKGSVWFQIGNGKNHEGKPDQINIDFENMNLTTRNWCQLYTNNDGRFAVQGSITKDLGASCEIFLGMNVGLHRLARRILTP
jgi:hypothetical protein